ncbi:MAG TPA: diguanylate cyclase [Solirubrobacteraceae bacterium]
MPRSIRLALAPLGGWIAACELHALGLRWIPIGPQKWLHLAVMAAGAGLCLLRGAVRRQERAAWLLIGGGVMAWVLGELYFTAVLWSDSSPPIPSLADAGYLSLPPLVFAGLIVLARSRIRRLPKTTWADGVSAGLAASAISAAIVFKPVLAAVSGGKLAIATNLSYPSMDLVLLGFIFGVLAVSGRRLDRRLGVLAAGIMCFWAADTVYLVKAAEGTWVSGGPYDPGWWTIAVCAAGAAWMRPHGQMLTNRRAEAISVPIAAAIASLAILVIGSITDVTLPAIVLATGALLSVLLRLVLTFRAHQATVQRSRHEALTDPMTGLGNRRAFAAALEERIDDDEAEPTILALFDLDGFKRFNDSFGHAAGDALLQRLAGALVDALSPRGAVFRMGGDEFCALLPAGPVGEALLHAAGQAVSDSGDGFTISASLGSVCLPAETDDVEEALRLADQRMYAQKHLVRRADAAHEVKDALLTAMSQRDASLSDHTDGVAELSAQTAWLIGCTQAQIEHIRTAAELHDIGKLAISEAILSKPGPLTEEEWELMRRHTVIGEQIMSASPALDDVRPLVRSSHERWDGGGYPDRLAGEDIPLGARIVAVCDSYHAMTTDRSYRKALSVEIALDELRACAGSQFDPAIVDAFLRLMDTRSESVRTQRNAGSDTAALSIA